ncbi:MAG: mismatch-specific DNA-glycosylase [Acidimicrobiia bacterium]|nr:mismatch-specific DNA-glycosylase [Acidimicrobiia bacterium]
MGFTKAQLEEFRGATVPDLIGDDCRLLFVGINPGLWTAATQTHFCHPSNRFYPALRRAGLIDFDLDTDTGMTEAHRAAFTGSGMGISNLVQRATVRADELSKSELIVGGKRLRDLVAIVRPAVVAVVGVTAFRTAFEAPKAALGLQELMDPASWWVLPNPSGLNAHVTIDGLAGWFRQAAEAGGL